MKLKFTCFALLLSACAPQYVETVATDDQDVPVRRALFAEDPRDLHAAFQAACDSPGDVFARPGRGITQCRTLPTPNFAAFLLLEYDGAIETPVVVMQKQARASDSATVIEFSYFAEVPQKTGTARRIYYKDRDLDRLLDRMMRAAGGTTIAG